MAKIVDVYCKKCGETGKLDIGDMTIEEATELLEKRKGFSCFGHHVELSSPIPNYWEIMPDTLREERVPTEEEWIADMIAKHGEIWGVQELGERFDKIGFSFGFCTARDKKTGEEVILDFTNSPKGNRYYFK
jgi:hypothetical protein